MFAIIIGLNVLLPFGITFDSEEGWELVSELDIDSEEETDKNEKESEEESDFESECVLFKVPLVDDLAFIKARQHLAHCDHLGINVFLDVETPPPNA